LSRAINGSVNLAGTGNLIVSCNTLNINAQITSAGTTIAPSRVTGTATQANVLSNAASIQQAIDISSTTAPVTVQVSSGQYAENLTIFNANLTLTSNVGTQSEGADPEAALLVGIKSGGSLIDVTAKNVTISGIRLHGDATTPSAVNGVYAKGSNELTVNHDTFAGFSGPAIETPESANVTLNANAFTPTLLSTAVTPLTPAVAPRRSRAGSRPRRMRARASATPSSAVVWSARSSSTFSAATRRRPSATNRRLSTRPRRRSSAQSAGRAGSDDREARGLQPRPLAHGAG
jgi:hypothetical protein